METKDNLIEIKKSIEQNKDIFTSMGVTNGLAGLSLFYFYCYKFDNEQEYLDQSVEALQQAINGLNENYEGPNVINDIVEIAILLQLYEEQCILSKAEIAPFLENYEPVLLELMKEHIENKRLNPITGALKFGNYFIEKDGNELKEVLYIFDDVIDLIESTSRKDSESGGIYWTSEIQRKGDYKTELGFRHGIAGIIDFLLKIYDKGIQRDRVLILIQEAFLFLNHLNYERGRAYFPFSSDENSTYRSFNFGLVYGDLGIGYVYLKAGKILNNTFYRKTGNEVLKNASTYRDEEKKLIRDANLLYGNLGITSFFNMYSGEKETVSARNYWWQKTNSYKVENSTWAGFDTTFNKFDINAQISFSHGIIGIGIALMALEMDLSMSYMKFLNYYPIT